MGIYVQLLGTAKVQLESHSVPFVSDKRFLLLAFLAFKADWVSRDQLANLFWSDTDSVSARKNLRHLLSRTRNLDFAQLEGQDDVRWLVQTDVALFQQHLGAGDWEQAIALYQGNLLSGLTSDSSGFEDWLGQESETLQTAYREAALNHAKQLEGQNRFDDAAALLAKVLKIDLLAEDIVQVYLRVAGQAGHRLEALKVFESFKSMLSLELGLLPLETTLQLAADLRLESKAASQAPVEMLRNFPTHSTPFVGRDVDLSEIAAYFEQPEVRLMTLIGTGGIGKTRLAIQVALEQAKYFSDGAVFVPLSEIAASENIVPAIAQALDFSFSSFDSQDSQLQKFLGDKHLLLVLDNLEHLLDGANSFLELLAHCPKLRILTTSREALDFQGEYLVDVLGLDVPKDPNTEQIEMYDAVQLFLRSVRRVNPQFSLEREAKPFVLQICQMLQGSPLAIELAANWLRVLDVQAVKNEIQKSLDFLEINQPNIAHRHRSMRAVCNSSWVRLEANEQATLACLSLFRGGFSAQSAARVANANPGMLLRLVNKSLVSKRESRFFMHEALRQFAAEKLGAPEKDAALHKLSLLAQEWAQAVYINETTPKDLESCQNFETEYENIDVALEWSFQTMPRLCAEIVCAPVYFWYASARKQVAIAWISALLELPELKGRDALRSKLLYSRCVLGDGARDYELCLIDANVSLEIAIEIADLDRQAWAWCGIGICQFELGRTRAALESNQKAWKLSLQVQNQNVQAYCQTELGNIYVVLSEFELAAQVYGQTISRCLATGNRRSLAHAHTFMADAYARQGKLELEQETLEKAAVIYRGFNDVSNLCGILLRLASVNVQRKNLVVAEQTLREASKLCQQLHEVRFYFRLFHLFAIIAGQRGLPAKALRLHFIASDWSAQLEAEVDVHELDFNRFDLEPIQAPYSQLEIEQIKLEASNLSAGQTVQYALGQLEMFDDPPLSQSLAVQAI